MFDPVAYFNTIAKSLNDLYDYYYCKVSGIDHLEEVLTNQKKYKKFLAIDDSDDGKIMKGNGYAFYERRFYTCFILIRADYNNMEQRTNARNEARDIFRKMLSKMVQDEAYHRNNMKFMDTSNISFYEFPGVIGPGCGGIYFTFSLDNPVNLEYNASDWS